MSDQEFPRAEPSPVAEPNDAASLERSALARRRSFVIHAFAGLAVATTQGCGREASASGWNANDRVAASTEERSGKRMGAAPPRSAPAPAVRTDGGAASDGGGDGSADGSTAEYGGLGVIGTIGIGHTGGGEYFHGNRMGTGGRSRPRVRFGELRVRGAMVPEVVRRITRQHTGQLLYCFERALPENPELHGGVTFDYAIGPTGTVTSSQATPSRAPMQPVADCVSNALRGWRFPAPTDAGNVTVAQQVEFTPPAP